MLRIKEKHPITSFPPQENKTECNFPSLSLENITTRNLLFAALVFSFASNGMGSIWDCTKEDIIIRQHRTGEKVQGKPEFNVMALNACPCFQENVTLDCTGFHTVKSIDPLEVTIRGNQCLLVNGSGLVPYSGASFYYAWDTQFLFKPTYAHLNCSYAP